MTDYDYPDRIRDMTSRDWKQLCIDISHEILPFIAVSFVVWAVHFGIIPALSQL